MKTSMISIMFAAVAFSAFAVDVSIEGRWVVGGTPQQSVETTCELCLYGAENAGSPLVSTNGVRFATDSAGYFVVCASVAAPELPDTYWVGVKPLGRAEISPRFRVAPVPYSLAAAEVALVRCDGQFELSGTAHIDRLNVEGDASIDDWIVPAGGSVQTKNLQLDNVRVTGLTICNAGMLGLFTDPGSSHVSYDYDSFTAEKTVYAETDVDTSGFMGYYLDVKTQTDAQTCSFDSDGFLMIALMADPKKSQSPRVSVTVGQTTILDDRPFGFDKGPVVKRFMTVPYRAGERVSITVSAIGYDDHVDYGWGFTPSEWKSSVGAKVRLVRFGRN